MKLKSLIVVSMLCTASAFAVPPPQYGSNTQNQTSPMATNVAPFASWSPGWVLADTFPKARDWIPVACDFSGQNVGSLDLDDQRWVRSLGANQCATTNIYYDQAGHYPAGEYTLLFEGEGTFVAGPEDNEVFYTTGMETETHNGLKKLTFTVNQATQNQSGIGFFLMAQETDYIRNIRLISPGGVCGRSETELDRFRFCATSRGGTGQCNVDEQCYDMEDVYFDRFTDTQADMETKVVFHPEYIKHYQPYTAIRYMKWSRPEDSTVVTWNDRVTMSEAMFTLEDRGFPYEYMIAMSNQLNADAYFNIPVLADDPYIIAYGAQVSSQLRSTLDVHIEYGNEFFNELQAVPYSHALTQANLVGSGIPSTDSDLVKVAKWSSREAVRVMNLWQAQFATPSRVSKVIAGFNPIPEYTLAALDFNNSYTQIDALAMSGYIGPDRRFVDDQTRFDNLTVNEVFEEITDGRHLNSGASLVDLNAVYQTAYGWASTRNLDLILYEAGQHIVSTGAPQSTTNVMLQANRDSQMGTAYTNNFNQFRSANGTLMFHFLVEDMWNANGSFGLIEHQNDDTQSSPKYQAIMNFINNNPCWWTGCGH